MECRYEMLTAEQIPLLCQSLAALGAYHNRIAENREYAYPTRPVEETAEQIADAVAGGQTLVRAAWVQDQLAGFCIISMDKDSGVGELKYLYTEETCRSMGIGSALTDWAMETFADAGIQRIDLRVVLGNPAVEFYEKYGFAPRLLVMSKKI